MITLKDLGAFLLILVGWLVLSIVLLSIDRIANSDYAFFIIFLLVIAGTSLTWNYYKRKKSIANFLEHQFNRMGYNVLAERSFNFKEKFTTSEIKVAFWTPIGLFMDRIQYKSKFFKVFVVSNSNGQRLELAALVTFYWEGEPDISILGKTPL